MGKPIWISDAVENPNFPRASIAHQAGAVFAFPIGLGEATNGVMEFFGREIQEPDEALLHQMLSVGSQIGNLCNGKRQKRPCVKVKNKPGSFWILPWTRW